MAKTGAFRYCRSLCHLRRVLNASNDRECLVRLFSVLLGCFTHRAPRKFGNWYSDDIVVSMDKDDSVGSLVVASTALIKRSVVVDLSCNLAIALEFRTVTVVGRKAEMLLNTRLQLLEGACQRN